MADRAEFTLSEDDFKPYAVKPFPGEPTVPGRPEYDLKKAVEPVSTLEDMKRSAVSAGVTVPFGMFGQVGDVRDLLGRAADYMTRKSGQEPSGNRINTFLDLFPNTSDLKRASGIGDKYDWESQTLPGAITGGVVSGAGTVATGGLPGLMRKGAERLPGYAADIARFGVVPGVTAPLAGRYAKEVAPDFEIPAELLGGAVGSKLGTWGITPHPNTSTPASRDTHAMHVGILDNEGLGGHITAGERSNDPMQRKKEAQLDPKHWEKSLEAITEKATGEVGPQYATKTFQPATTDPVTGQRIPGTLEKMRTETGQRIGAITGDPRNFIDAAIAGPDLGLGMNKMITEYKKTMGYDPKVEAEMVRMRDQLAETFAAHGVHPSLPPGTRSNHIPGDVYQNMTSDLFKKQKAAFGANNPDLAHAYQNVRGLLDDAFESSVGHHNPNDLGELQAARKAYKAYLTVADAQGVNPTAISYVTPAALDRSASHVYGDTAQAEGRTPFRWAPSARTVMRTEPTSGTAEHLMMSGLKPAAIGTIAAGTLGAGYGLTHGYSLADIAQLAGITGGGGSAAGAIGMLAAKPIEKALYTTDIGKKYHGNQLLTGAEGFASPLGLMGTGATLPKEQSSEERAKTFRDFFSNTRTPEETARRTPRRTSVRGLLNREGEGE